MFMPYMRDPFISQAPDVMYTFESPGPSVQHFSQPFAPVPEYYPMQPYESYQDTDLFSMGTIARPGDPPPVLSNNPATTRVVLFKELTGYPNYGNPSRNADILYTGNRGTWTFNLPVFLVALGNMRAQLVIRAVLDDHSNVPLNRYAARITINGTVVHNGLVPLQHGTPAGGMFTNWRDLTFNVTNMRRSNNITIVNTSTAGPDDWIGLDWMELRILPR